MCSAEHHDVYGVILLLILAAGCTSQECVLPAHPDHGKHYPFEEDCPPERKDTPSCLSLPGTRVQDGWFLFVRCNEGFVPDSDDHGYSQSTCADGKWLPALPSCVYKLTDDANKCVAPPYPLNGKYKPLIIECALSRISEDFLHPGTFVPSSCVLLYSCNEGYELAEEDVISVCDKGDWIPKNIRCKPGANAVVTKRPVSSIGCTLPKKAEHRTYCSFQCRQCSNQYNTECSYSPGSVVNQEVIQVQCSQGYRLEDNREFFPITCNNGNWTTAFPKCLKQCPPLESDSVFPQCQLGTTQVECDKPVLPTTTAVYQCKPSYTPYAGLARAGLYSRTITCKHSGKWSHTLPECEPACGVSKGGVKIVPTIYDGTETPLGAFPWHVGLYKRNNSGIWNCICGGSLITNRVVITAAHCVNVLTPPELRVAMGKTYRDWGKVEEFAVRRNVSYIRVPREYSGAVNTYAWDIALVLLSEKVQFNSFVMPVCRDVQLTLRVTENTTGYVVGWGKTMEHGAESELLLHNDLNIIDYSLCFRKIPKILAFDKFCGAKGSVSIVEKGDSGGGVTVVHNDQHYIIGIVSVKLDSLSVFTNVSWSTHKRWIDNEIINFDKDITLSDK